MLDFSRAAWDGRPHRRAPHRASVLLVVYALGLGACYSYAAPASGMSPHPGTDVRIRLTESGSAQFASVLGPRVEAVEGSLMQTGSDSVVLRAVRTVGYDGRENPYPGGRVALPAATVASLRTWQLDRPRTVLSAIAGLGVLVASALAFRGKADDGSSTVVGGGPPATQ